MKAMFAFFTGLGVMGMLAMFVLWIALFIGWFMNIYKLVTMNFDPITGWLIMRIAGIPLAPLGGILGWMN